MLPKRKRLTHADFERYFRSGHRYHSRYFTLIHTPGTPFHGAVAVPRKLTRTAVARNKLRRRIYDILYRRHADGVHGGIYIVLVKKPALAATYAELHDSLATLIRDASQQRAP